MIHNSSRTKSYLPAQQRSYLLQTPEKHLNRSLSKGSSRLNTSQNRYGDKKKTQIKLYNFSDSIYQGQIKAFHRSGKGIILHDNGLCGIIKSGSNRLKDHNVFFGQGILISAEFLEHQISFVFKHHRDMLVLVMDRSDSSVSLTNPGYLIEYEYKRVSKLKFKNNVLKQKILLTREETNDILKEQGLKKIMKPQHIQALKMNIFDQKFPSIEIIPKFRNQLHVGFVDTSQNTYQTTYDRSFGQKQYHNKNLQGLGFIIERTQYNPTNIFDFEFRVMERGFFKNGRLQYLGQKYYQNGNYYFGGIKDNKMHGQGILIYPNQNRFAFGTFSQGKPIKLEEKKQYQLSSQYGKQIYQGMRLKIHSGDPQKWIDGEIIDIPEPQYFMAKMKESLNFLGQDQQVTNYLKNQQDLKLSRKVDQFESGNKYQKRLYLKPPSTITFGRDQIGDPIHESLRDQQSPRLRKRTLSSQLIHTPLRQSRHQIDSKIIFQNSVRSHNHLDDSIIKRVNSRNGDFDYIDKKVNIDDPHNEISALIGKGYAQNFNNNKFQDLRFTERKQKSGQKMNDSFQRQGQKISYSKQKNPKHSIINRLYKQENQRAEDLERQYQQLERNSSRNNSRNQYQNSDYRPIHKQKIQLPRNSPQKGQSNFLSPHKAQLTQYLDKPREYVTPSRRKTPNVNSYPDKYMQAGYEAIKLATSNKIKEQKFMHYDHYSHKRHFDYTSDDKDLAARVGHQTKVAYSKHLDRTPQKTPKYDTSEFSSAQRTLKKHQTAEVIDRLYPHENNLNFQSSKKYDSSYLQYRPLNTSGKTFEADKNLKQDSKYSDHFYGKDYKNSIIKNNAVTRY